MSDEPLVLGIETSCDETGVGLVRGRTLLADAVALVPGAHHAGVSVLAPRGRAHRVLAATDDARGRVGRMAP